MGEIAPPRQINNYENTRNNYMQEIIKKAITGLEGESAEGKHYDWYHGMNEQEIVCDPLSIIYNNPNENN